MCVELQCCPLPPCMHACCSSRQTCACLSSSGTVPAATSVWACTLLTRWCVGNMVHPEVPHMCNLCPQAPTACGCWQNVLAHNHETTSCQLRLTLTTSRLGVENTQ
jgi:hypothetical protein